MGNAYIKRKVCMMRYKFNKTLYPKTALLKAAYNYTDKAFIHLDADDDFYYVDLEMKADGNEIGEKDFLNEMLAQSVRHEVYLQTKNIRELMLARAMATTIVADTDIPSEDSAAEDEFSENEILKDWFAENDNSQAKQGNLQ